MVSINADARAGRPAATEAARPNFYAGLPVFDSFENLTDPSIYTALP
ncbi:DUF3095 domain-containing protein, partial [Microvirga brassicacearum]